MSHDRSFLPEDYLAQKAERRTNLICLVLFAIVMLGVLLAFMVTNKKAAVIKQSQIAINQRYQKAAEQIKELSELESQKEEMLQKAELASALVERAPRSILLAEFINRMPDQLSLLEFDLKSEKIKQVVQRASSEEKKTGRLKGSRAKTKEEAAREGKKARILPPRYRVNIGLVGVAPTDVEVSHFLAELNTYSLFKNVSLDYSEEKEVDGQLMREFGIQVVMKVDADMRAIDPLIVPRGVRDPMSEELRFIAPGAGKSTAAITGSGQEDH